MKEREECRYSILGSPNELAPKARRRSSDNLTCTQKILLTPSNLDVKPGTYYPSILIEVHCNKNRLEFQIWADGDLMRPARRISVTMRRRRAFEVAARSEPERASNFRSVIGGGKVQQRGRKACAVRATFAAIYSIE